MLCKFDCSCKSCLDGYRALRKRLKDGIMENRPKKTYEQLEAELKRVKTKSSARKRNLQGLNSTVEAYRNLNSNYWNTMSELRKENDALRKEINEIKTSKAYRIVYGVLGKK